MVDMLWIHCLCGRCYVRVPTHVAPLSSFIELLFLPATVVLVLASIH